MALGLTLSTGAPALGWVAAGPPSASAGVLATVAADRPAVAVDGSRSAGAPGSNGGTTGIPPDWPGASGGPPDGSAPTAAGRVVQRGDCLWDIATDWLAAQRPGDPVGDADTLVAVAAWWRANAAVIGPDPDLLLPGQALSAPSSGVPPAQNPPTQNPPTQDPLTGTPP